MIVDLENLHSDHCQLAGDESIAYHTGDGEETRIACHIDVDVRRLGDTYYLDVQLNAELPANCDRCLEPIRYRLQPAFEVVVKRSRESSADVAGEGGDDFVVLPYSTKEFSLDRHIYENLVVDIPMQIVCRDDCRGLCPGCGENLNNSACRCEQPVDNRWNELKKLRDQLP